MTSLVSVSGGEANFDVADIQVTGLTSDSRKVAPGNLFFALVGDSVDGHRFVPEALEKGAVAAVVERAQDTEARLIVVPDTRVALAEMARRFYLYPDRDLRVIGITGTNGKTTTTYMVRSIARAGGIPFEAMGTLGYTLGDRQRALSFTTPSPENLFSVLAEIRDAGAEGLAMEISSHGISQRRSWGLGCSAAAFTNLSQDHLDYHGDMESYFFSKAELFEGLSPEAPSVIGIDSDYGRRLTEITASSKVVTFGFREGADVTAENIITRPDGSSFDLITPEGEVEVELPVPGSFNVLNALCASGIALSMGWSLDAIVTGLAAYRGIPGRLEPVSGNQPFAVYVDYSHTPDALESALLSCREIAENRVIVVFGAGGDRDTDKRPKMGKIAGRLSDIAVVTSDNPRSENPADIIDDILRGMDREMGVVRIDDRGRAIRRAISLAEPEDVILIAGKGHEDYQIIGETRRHFDDREEAAKALKEAGYEVID